MPLFLLFNPCPPSHSPGWGLTDQGSRMTCSSFSPVPHDALPSDLLENVLCGVAFGLGMLGIIVGLVLIVYFRKPCSWYIGVSGVGGQTMGATYSGACGGMPKVILWYREACVGTMDILLVGIPVTYIHTYTQL